MASSPILIALDFETAGYYRHSACAIGMVRIEDRTIVNSFYTLIKPPSPRIYFTHIHGLTWKDLKEAPTFTQIWDEMADFMDGAHYLLAHNAGFDRSVLKACTDHFGAPMPDLPFLDTLRGSRKAYQLPSHSLGAVCDHLGISLDHHNALSDAFGCASIYLHLVKNGLDENAMLLNAK